MQLTAKLAISAACGFLKLLAHKETWGSVRLCAGTGPLNFISVTPGPGLAPGQYEGRIRLQVLPGYTYADLIIRLTHQGGAGQPITCIISADDLRKLAGTGWFEIRVGPVDLLRQGTLELSVYSPTAGGLLWDNNMRVVVVPPGKLVHTLSCC